MLGFSFKNPEDILRFSFCRAEYHLNNFKAAALTELYI